MMMRWVWFLVLLLGAMLGLVRQDDTLEFSDAVATLVGSPAYVGGTMPSLTLASEAARKRIDFSGHSNGTTMILSTCTSCDIDYIKQWEISAQQRNDRIIIVLHTAPKELASMRPRFRPSAALYSNQRESLYRSLGFATLPAVVVTSQNGTILDVAVGRKG